MKLKRIVKLCLAWVMISVFLCVSTSGCFGSFALTRKIYHFNQRIDKDKWIQWIAFLGMSIIPVYGLGLAVDIFFGNPVEFWTGENPINADAETTKIAYGPGGEIIRATRINADTVRLDALDSNHQYYNMLFVHEGDAVSAYTPSGRLIARVNNINKTPELSVAAGL